MHWQRHYGASDDSYKQYLVGKFDCLNIKPKEAMMFQIRSVRDPAISHA